MCRCPPVNNTSEERCVELPDPTDPCCTVVLCDVTEGDHDVNKAGEVVVNLSHLMRSLDGNVPAFIGNITRARYDTDRNLYFRIIHCRLDATSFVENVNENQAL